MTQTIKQQERSMKMEQAKEMLESVEDGYSLMNRTAGVKIVPLGNGIDGWAQGSVGTKIDRADSIIRLTNYRNLAEFTPVHTGGPFKDMTDAEVDAKMQDDIDVEVQIEEERKMTETMKVKTTEQTQAERIQETVLRAAVVLDHNEIDANKATADQALNAVLDSYEPGNAERRRFVTAWNKQAGTFTFAGGRKKAAKKATANGGKKRRDSKAAEEKAAKAEQRAFDKIMRSLKFRPMKDDSKKLARANGLIAKKQAAAKKEAAPLPEGFILIDGGSLEAGDLIRDRIARGEVKDYRVVSIHDASPSGGREYKRLMVREAALETTDDAPLLKKFISINKQVLTNRTK